VCNPARSMTNAWPHLAHFARRPAWSACTPSREPHGGHATQKTVGVGAVVIRRSLTRKEWFAVSNYPQAHYSSRFPEA
jgi:hypothetical protein